ncbi:EF-hand domain-containing protein [Streptomyces sp. NPDC058646]|uniref:EF-hand domain-containing protein n=1 Tax=Streptomyces sp. NPDC058646 TaxID=3346574 RepID=UPI0036552C02
MGDADARPGVRTVFEAFDTDDDWLLDVHEFGGAIGRLTGQSLSGESLEHLFRMTDVDGDGLVSLPEFEDCVREL